MRRREFVALLGSALAWPLVARAQQRARRPRVGVLIFSTPRGDPGTESLLSGLRELGYEEGRNIDIEYRFAEGRTERLAELARELVAIKPDLLIALGGDVTPFVSQATKTIPIIYASSADPVGLGLAESLNKPGGNATGVTFLSDELAAKRLEVLKEAAPRISRVGLLRDPSHVDNELLLAQRAAVALGIQLQSVEMHGRADLDRALNAAARAGIDALYVVSSRHTVLNVLPIVEFAAANRLPLAGGWGAWVEAGGLVSYGPNVGDMVRHSAVYVDKVLKGARPGELPIEQPTRFELMVNLRTAKTLGLSIPEAFLLRADKVIE